MPAARWIRSLALAGLLLCFTVVVLGAYVRLTAAGLGCPDWPGCYGHVTPLGAQESASAQAAYPTEALECRQGVAGDDPSLCSIALWADHRGYLRAGDCDTAAAPGEPAARAGAVGHRRVSRRAGHADRHLAVEAADCDGAPRLRPDDTRPVVVAVALAAARLLGKQSQRIRCRWPYSAELLSKPRSSRGG